jgi:hypothetical protein
MDGLFEHGWNIEGYAGTRSRRIDATKINLVVEPGGVEPPTS